MVDVRRSVATVAAALAAGLTLGSCMLVGGGGFKVDAIFADIGDLPRFANVQTSDVVVGTVTGIRLDGYNARVTLRIDDGTRIPANAEALVRSTSLLGEKFVDLRPPEEGAPSAEVLRDGDVIPLERTERLPGIDDAFVKLGRLLQGGTAGDLASIIHSSAEIVRDREDALGRIFSEMSGFSEVLATRSPDLAAAIEDLDTAFKALAGGGDTIRRALGSSADAVTILADQRTDLDRLVGSLDRASEVLARYGKATRPSSDAALKDLRLVLDQVMRTTDDLEAALTALASFVDLWPRAIPSDYVQLDIVLTLENAYPPAAGASASQGSPSLEDFLWGPVR